MKTFPALFMLLATTPAWATKRAPGEVVDPAVAVDVTPEGLNALGALLTAVLPPSIDIPELSGGDTSGEDCVSIFGADLICWTPWTYAYSLTGLAVDLHLDQLKLTPDTDKIDILLNLSLEVPAGALDLYAHAADINLFGVKFTLLNLDQTCQVGLAQTPISFSTTLTLTLDLSSPEPDVHIAIAPVHLTADLHNKLQVTGCAAGTLVDFIDGVSGFLNGAFNFDIYQMLLDLVTPIADQAINGLLGDLEHTLSDALGSLSLHMPIDLLDKQLELAIDPSELRVTPEGLRFALKGSLAGSGLPDPCISAYPTPGSRATGQNPPAIGEGDGATTHDLGILIDDDLVNEALYAAWYEGVLCFALDPGELGGSIPIPLDTSLFKTLAQGAYPLMFEAHDPILISTRPRTAPSAAIGGGNDIDVTLSQFGLDLYAPLDDRIVRVVGMELNAQVGVDLDFDPLTGQMGVGLDISGDSLALSPVFSDLDPEGGRLLTSKLGSLIGTIITPLVGGLTSDLAFTLPTFEGLGITDVHLAPVGPDADFLGILASIGEVPYEGGDLSEGCGSGCESGCTQGGPAPLAGFGLLGLLWIRRRQRTRV